MLTFKRQFKFIKEKGVEPIPYTGGKVLIQLCAKIYSPDPYSPNSVKVEHVEVTDEHEIIEITYTVPKDPPDQTDIETLWGQKKVGVDDNDRTGVLCVNNPALRPFDDSEKVLILVEFELGTLSSKLLHCYREFTSSNLGGVQLIFHARTIANPETNERFWILADYDQRNRGNPLSVYNWVVARPDLWTLYIQEIEIQKGIIDSVVIHNPKFPFPPG